MSLYADLAETARALLEEFGLPGGYACREVTGTFDKVRGGMTSRTTREQIITAVRVPVNQAVVDQLDVRQTGESLTASEVIMLKVAAADLEFDLALGQVIVVDGSELPIVAMAKVRPADVTILYTVALRK